MDERALIQQLLAGDQQAYRHVVRAYHGVMTSMARAIVGPAAAADVVQDAWIAVVRALPRFEGRSSLRTWVLQIVSNTAKTRRRKEQRSIAAGDAGEVEDLALAGRFQADGHWQLPPAHWQTSSPEQHLEQDQLRSVIEQAVEKLPESQKTVLTLCDIEGVDMDEVCKILEVTESNGRVLLHRARTRVWSAIDRFQRGEEQ
jgi:RNA polymerase sigma-70 factor (ECF subfamily)